MSFEKYLEGELETHIETLKKTNVQFKELLAKEFELDDYAKWKTCIEAKQLANNSILANLDSIEGIISRLRVIRNQESNDPSDFRPENRIKK